MRCSSARVLRLDVKTRRGLCRVLFEQGRWFRGPISLTGTEQLAGQTLVIGIDGGRLRERRRKRGRKKAGQKRQGYHTDWKEPKLFTVDVLDNEGQVLKSFAPVHDATMQNHQGLFALLERYLDALDLGNVARIVFCGDGAPWIGLGSTRCANAGGSIRVGFIRSSTTPMPNKTYRR